MPPRKAHLRRARHWIANRGWSGFLEEMLRRAEFRLRGKPIPGRPRSETTPHPFDVEHGVDTNGLVWGESLGTGQPGNDAQYWATGYYGIAPSAFNAAINRLALDWPLFTFIDIGCGKGRALMLSLRLPLRRAIGIELSPELAEIARQNLATFHPLWRQTQVAAEVITSDATTLPLPSGPLLLLLYHPFAAPVMRRFLDHLHTAAKAEPREIYLLYANPELAPMLDATPGCKLLWQQWWMLTPDEIAADRFGSTQENINAYCIQP